MCISTHTLIHYSAVGELKAFVKVNKTECENTIRGHIKGLYE